MKKSLFFGTIYAFATLLTHQQGSCQQNDQVLENVYPIRHIDPTECDYSDLEIVCKSIGNAKIVFLGEPTHGDGSVFRFKTRLVKYLHQQMGFDVIAWECGQLDMEFVNSALDGGDKDFTSVENHGMLSFWRNSTEIRELFDYVQQTKRTKRPIFMSGIDPQLTAGDKHFWIKYVLEIINDFDPAIIEKALQDSLNAAYDEILTKRPSEITETKAAGLLKQLERKLADYHTRLLYKYGVDEVFLVKQTIRDQIVQRQYMAGLLEKSKSGMKPEMNNPRDHRMAENIISLAQKRFPGKKIIVWLASLHAAYSPSTLADSSNILRLKGLISAGKIVKEKLGDEVYSLGFTASDGHFGNVYMTDPAPLSLPIQGSIEYDLSQSGFDYAYVDLKVKKNTTFFCRMLGYEFLKDNWERQVDGILWIREMKPVTKAK